MSILCLSDHARLVLCLFAPHAALRKYGALLARKHIIEYGLGIINLTCIIRRD